MRILIAEDERVTRHKLQRLLEKMGHEVVATAHGLEAWEQFQADPVSMIICDWEMPEMDGPELVRRIRGAQRGGYVYIVMLTGKSEKRDIIAGMEAGADDFISKPFDRNELRVRLNAGQRIIKLERQLADQNQILSAANRRMSRDLDAAAKFQQSLLPTATLDSVRAEFSWQYLPCDELAGDFLNFFPLDDKHIAIYVVDVSGHGVASSLLSVTIGQVLTPQSALLRRSTDTKKGAASPAAIAEQLNRRFPMEDQNGLYFTMVYGVLSLDSLEFRYVSAGHDPLVHLKSTEPPLMLPGDGMPIGWFDDATYQDHVVQLAPGDRLYFYSDGVPEAMNEASSTFGNQRMLDSLATGRDLPLEQSVATLLASVRKWSQVEGPKDDVTILGVEIKREDGR